MSKLVIVESPTKAKTISRFLKNGFKIESSFGHVRDLPKSDLGVDVEKDFAPKYIIPAKARKNVSNLKKLAEKSDEVILATDEDREGEAIAWHLAQALKIDPAKSKRIVFHEITQSAILEALKNPRTIDQHLVDAQQARRILDRLVGYLLSPLLWKKIRRGLSAGRVQSVAVRLIVDREREIEKFKPEEYWTIIAELEKNKITFEARLAAKDGKVIKKLEIKNKKEADQILTDLKNADYIVSDIKKVEKKRSPAPPFTTSTLQQAAAHRLGFSAKKTMVLAQQLYEGLPTNEGPIGLITYMRTDSVNLAKQALAEAQKVLKENYGEKYSLPSPRLYKTKSRLAQEAHEAIRPSSLGRFPENIKSFLDRDQFRLYDLIWRRTLASQMPEAIFDSTTADIQAKNYTFRANGSMLKFDGFLKVYSLKISENELPALEVKEKLTLKNLKPDQHFTEPPPRYGEATLIKTLEELGIGRPSTYAPTISTIIDRGYVEKLEGKLHPKDIGLTVNDLLVKHFPEIVDFKFTAHMEEDLDKIAENQIAWVPVIKEFYVPFKKDLDAKDKEITKEEFQEKTDEKCPKCESPMVIKFGRFGRFIACSKYPECKTTKPIGEEKKLHDEFANEKCEKCGAPMIVRRGRFGPFLGCSKYPECKGIKPIVRKTGVKCPQCNVGDIIEKKSKKGRFFYACSEYPKCKFALWQKPTGEKCPQCNSLLVYAGKDKIKCSSKECKYEK